MASIVSQAAQAPFATAAAAVSVVSVVYLAYQWALPKPIPGIPYNEADTKTIMGSLPRLIAGVAKNNGRAQAWLAKQSAEHNSPLVQIWFAPFTRPAVIVADFQEAQDILVRRTKEFDRSSTTTEGFKGVIPGHQMSLHTADPRFKGNRELVRDLMSPNFLHTVSAPEIYKKTQSLIDLWRFKVAAVTNGLPFEAGYDMHDAAMDVVTAAAFAFDNDMSVIHTRLEQCRTGDAQPVIDANGGNDFPRAPYPKMLQPLRDVAKYMGDVISSPAPRMAHLFRMTWDWKLRANFAAKDKVIFGQIQQSLDRFQAGNDVQRSACDFLIQRQTTIAEKEGQAPDYFSERIRDEASTFYIRPLVVHMALC